MTYNINWFSFFRRWENSVRIGDDKKLTVQGSGSVQIQMHDGTVGVLNAWYVPALRKNLISLGTHDKQGFRYTSDNGQLKVFKCALTVIKGKLQKGIYHLLGKTTIGFVAAASFSK